MEKYLRELFVNKYMKVNFLNWYFANVSLFSTLTSVWLRIFMCGQLKRTRLLKQNLGYFLYSFSVILWMELKRTKTENVMSCCFYVSSFPFQVYRWFSIVSLNRECYSRHIFFGKFITKDLRLCEIISGCIYWHLEQFLNICWRLSIAANKVCIWRIISLSQWRMTTFKKEIIGNTHGALHHSHHLFTTVQKQRNKERSLYGKLSVISLEAVWIETLPSSL